MIRRRCFLLSPTRETAGQTEYRLQQERTSLGGVQGLTHNETQFPFWMQVACLVKGTG